MRSEASGDTQVLWFWRTGNVVMHLRLGGGDITPEEARVLADSMRANLAG